MKIRYKQKNKSGMSLIEMIIAISIFSMGLVGFTVLFTRVWKANSFIVEENLNAYLASKSVQKISGTIRGIRQSANGEYMIKSASDNELIVYVDDDKDGTIERVRFYIDSANEIFKKGVAKPSGVPLAYPADYASDTLTNIASNVVNIDNSEPLFKYYGNSNNLLPPPARPTEIKVIELNLWINTKPTSAPDNVRIGTSVEIRSLDESI